MSWNRVRAAFSWATCLFMLAGCAAVTPPVPARPEASSVGSRGFEALVRSLRDSVAGEIRIDPRVLSDRIQSRQLYDTTAGRESAESRGATLHTLGIDTTDALRDAGCGGMLPPAVEPERPAVCPRAGDFRSISIGEIIESDSAPPPSAGPTPAPSTSTRYWTVPVTVRLMTPEGSSSTTYRYWLICESRCSAWRVVHREPVLFTD
jgi:hypothetical protein